MYCEGEIMDYKTFHKIDDNSEGTSTPNTEQTPSRNTLPRILRLVGSCIIIISTIIFMVKDWSNYSHIQMYLSFLGFTAILTFCGYICGKHDLKGAKTLYLLVAALAPVHFAQLGGFLFSQFGHLQADKYINAFTWQAQSAISAILITLVGLLVLTPLAYISLSKLFSSKALFLTKVYFIANCTLLIPFRSAAVIIPLAFILFCTVLFFDFKRISILSEVKSLEGRLVRLMLYIPAVLLIARTYCIYDRSTVVIGITFILLALALFAASYSEKENNSHSANVLQFFATCSAIAGWLLIGKDMVDSFNIEEAYRPDITFLPVSAILIIAGKLSFHNKKGYYLAAACFALLISAIQIYVDSYHAALLMVIALSTFCYGYIIKDKFLEVISLIFFIIGILSQLKFAITESSIFPWIILGTTGVLVIFAATYFEKHPPTISNNDDDDDDSFLL